MNRAGPAGFTTLKIQIRLEPHSIQHREIHIRLDSEYITMKPGPNRIGLNICLNLIHCHSYRRETLARVLV